MSFPANPTLESGPYGPWPVLPVVGPQGGPYDLVAPKTLTLLPSASRTATISSAAQTNNGYRGVYISFTVTVNPGGAQTLALTVEIQDPVTSAWFPLLTVPASAAPGVVAWLYPGASGAAVEAVSITRNLSLPATWRVTVTHSGAGAWTYSVAGIVLP